MDENHCIGMCYVCWMEFELVFLINFTSSSTVTMMPMKRLIVQFDAMAKKNVTWTISSCVVHLHRIHRKKFA